MDTTVAKGFRVLEHLSRAEGPVRLSDLATQLDLRKSNVHRLLSTLVALGYAQREPDTGRYFASLKVWELGALVVGRYAVRRAAAPFLEELHRQAAETVSLVILDQDEILYLDQIMAPRPVRRTSRPGGRAPALYPASGKALLAQEPNAPDILERLAAAAPEPVDMAALRKELAVIRERGYALSLSGWSPGVNSVAAVIKQQGAPAAAIAISGPAERMGAERLADLGQQVLNACTRIEDILGKT